MDRNAAHTAPSANLTQRDALFVNLLIFFLHRLRVHLDPARRCTSYNHTKSFTLKLKTSTQNGTSTQ